MVLRSYEWIKQRFSVTQKELDSEGGGALSGGKDGTSRGWGTCTHSEVLLQRVSILLLWVEGGEEGHGCDGNGDKEYTTRTMRYRGHITGHSMQRGTRKNSIVSNKHNTQSQNVASSVLRIWQPCIYQHTEEVVIFKTNPDAFNSLTDLLNSVNLLWELFNSTSHVQWCMFCALRFCLQKAQFALRWSVTAAGDKCVLQT